MVQVLYGLDYVLLFFRVCIFFLGFYFVLTPMITICFLALFLSTSSSFFARPPRPLRHTKASLAPFPPRGPPLRQIKASLLLHLLNIIPHHSPEVVIRHIHPTDQWLAGQWRGQWLCNVPCARPARTSVSNEFLELAAGHPLPLPAALAPSDMGKLQDSSQKTQKHFCKKATQRKQFREHNISTAPSCCYSLICLLLFFDLPSK